MNILVINCGSSTLKFQLVDSGSERCLAWGLVDRIGRDGSVKLENASGKRLAEQRSISDHGEATLWVLEWAGGAAEINAVGHRVVHGGNYFVQPTVIDEQVIGTIDELSYLAPLHNDPSVWAMRATLKALPSVPGVAVFDTAFHSSMPPRASSYAIPYALAEKHHIRRYGFHGLAHRYMVERYAYLTSRDAARTKLITLQLGNGCSGAAVAGGISVDTSMGFTPLEGLVMGTRSGDLDPSLVGYLASQEGMDIQDVDDLLNKGSGLLGVSGISGDMRSLLAGESQGDFRSALAVEMFCYRIKKYVGGYMAALGGTEAVVFGGGTGENSPEVRERICEGMEWCGLILDKERNFSNGEGCITVDGARVQAFLVKVNEEIIIARDTVKLLA